MTVAYNVYRRQGEVSEWDLIASNIASKSYSDDAVASGRSYQYRVSAIINGIEKFSDMILVTTLNPNAQELRWDVSLVTPPDRKVHLVLVNDSRGINLNPSSSGGWYKASGSQLRSAANGSYYFEMMVTKSTGGLDGNTCFGIAKSTVDHVCDSGADYNPGTGKRYQIRWSGSTVQFSGNDDYSPSWVLLGTAAGGVNKVLGFSIEPFGGDTVFKFYLDGELVGSKTITGQAMFRPHVCRWMLSSGYTFNFNFPNTLLYKPSGFSAWL